MSQKWRDYLSLLSVIAGFFLIAMMFFAFPDGSKKMLPVLMGLFWATLSYELFKLRRVELPALLADVTSGVSNRIYGKGLSGDIWKLVEAKVNHGNSLAKALSFLAKDADVDNVDLDVDGEAKVHFDKVNERLKEERKRQEVRDWRGEGLSRFADLFRGKSSIKEIGDEMLSELVTYLGVNQGAFYVAYNEEGVLRRISSFAYGSKKYGDQEIPFGEGLLGQVYLESEPVYMTEIPADHVRITSGLGDALPRSLSIIPCMHNEKVTAIIELASFSELEPHKKELVEILSRQLGGVVDDICSNEFMKNLLDESLEARSELEAQTEELRQNMEELLASQEELERQKSDSDKVRRELEARMRIMDKTMLLTESDAFGSFTYANAKFTEVTGYAEAEVLGKPHNILRHPKNPQSLFKEMWSTIKSGDVFRGRFPNIAKDGSVYWVDATVAGVFDKNGKVEKYISARYDITEFCQINGQHT